jgi:hypothetical protein
MVVVLARLVLIGVDVELGAAGSVPLVAPRLEQGVQSKNFSLSVICGSGSDFFYLMPIQIRIRILCQVLHSVGKSAMSVLRHRFQYVGPYIKIFWEKYCLALLGTVRIQIRLGIGRLWMPIRMRKISVPD